MTGVTATIAALERAVRALAEIDDVALVQVTAALDRFLGGEDFESALGLAPGWRRHIQVRTRDDALAALSRRHASCSPLDLARVIVAELRGVDRDGPRPDGAAGDAWLLARSGCACSERTLRRLIAEIRNRR